MIATNAVTAADITLSSSQIVRVLATGHFIKVAKIFKPLGGILCETKGRGDGGRVVPPESYFTVAKRLVGGGKHGMQASAACALALCWNPAFVASSHNLMWVAFQIDDMQQTFDLSSVSESDVATALGDDSQAQFDRACEAWMEEAFVECEETGKRFAEPKSFVCLGNIAAQRKWKRYYLPHEKQPARAGTTVEKQRTSRRASPNEENSGGNSEPRALGKRQSKPPTRLQDVPVATKGRRRPKRSCTLGTDDEGSAVSVDESTSSGSVEAAVEDEDQPKLRPRSAPRLAGVSEQQPSAQRAAAQQPPTPQPTAPQMYPQQQMPPPPPFAPQMYQQQTSTQQPSEPSTPQPDRTAADAPQPTAPQMYPQQQMPPPPPFAPQMYQQQPSTQQPSAQQPSAQPSAPQPDRTAADAPQMYPQQQMPPPQPFAPQMYPMHPPQPYAPQMHPPQMQPLQPYAPQMYMQQHYAPQLPYAPQPPYTPLLPYTPQLPYAPQMYPQQPYAPQMYPHPPYAPQMYPQQPSYPQQPLPPDEKKDKEKARKESIVAALKLNELKRDQMLEAKIRYEIAKSDVEEAL